MYVYPNFQEDRLINATDISEKQRCYVPGQCQVPLSDTQSKSPEVVKNQPYFRNILSTLKELMTSTSATSFVGKMRSAIGGPLSQVRTSASCLQTAPNQEHQTH